MVRMCSRPAGVVVSAPGEIGNQIQRHGTEPSARSQALVRISRRGPHCALNQPTVARVKRWTRTATVAGSLGLAAVIMSGCANGDGAGSTGSVEPGQVSGTFDTADRCIVRLHGKSGGGQPTIVDAGVTDVSPNGNAQGWGGRQWIYFPDEAYTTARDVVGDPVTDHATSPCAPAPNVKIALYWTGALDNAEAVRFDCKPIDWTCEGDSVIGVEAYAATLGVTVQASPLSDHEPYTDAPELRAWLA